MKTLADAQKLEAEAKAIRRAEKSFWETVKNRLDEVKEKFNLSEAGAKSEPSTAEKLGRSVMTFYGLKPEEVEAYERIMLNEQSRSFWHGKSHGLQSGEQKKLPG